MPPVKKMPLAKILQSQGFGSRRACEGLVAYGRVRVAGEVASDARAAFDPDGLPVEVDGEAWLCRAHVYVVLNKPGGYECSRRPSHHPGVLSLLPPLFSARNTQPVGRLDHDTTGLLLLSDDGGFIHRQSSPKHRVPKTYEATTHDPVTPGLVAMLLSGVQLTDEPRPLSAVSCRQLAPHRIEIVLEQGKYHQAKRMLAAAGNRCDALVRTAIGGLRLEHLGLPPGEWRFLDAGQLSLLTPSAGSE